MFVLSLRVRLLGSGFPNCFCNRFPSLNVDVTAIDGSTDRCCIDIVTNERALLSGSDQPVRKLGRLRILYVRRENKRTQTAAFAQWYMVHC